MQFEAIEHPLLLLGAHWPVQAIEAVRIYFCYRGRNAYRSTWVPFG